MAFRDPQWQDALNKFAAFIQWADQTKMLTRGRNWPPAMPEWGRALGFGPESYPGNPYYPQAYGGAGESPGFVTSTPESPAGTPPAAAAASAPPGGTTPPGGGIPTGGTGLPDNFYAMLEALMQQMKQPGQKSSTSPGAAAPTTASPTA